MTDRELLELAAKAAGFKLTEMNAGINGYFQIMERDGKPVYGHHCPPWNPLTDDGDALRLAVKLGIEVYQYYDSAACLWKGDEIIELHKDDPYAATRMAIVRAAAEIGKGMI